MTNLTIELCDVPGTMGVPEKEWVVTLDGKPIAKCDAKDDPDNPTFWYAPHEMGAGEDSDLSFHTRVAITDAIRHVTRLLWYK